MKLYRHFTSQEEIDREYNVGAAVPDSSHWLEWYGQKSAVVRREIACVLDARFGPTQDETVDVFPASHPAAPVLVFIHGGYWRWGSSKDFSLVARGPVGHGITVVVTNYSLCPSVTISEITRQSRAVVAWLHRKASRFNGDSDRIYVAGHSAGGQQVGMLAATDWPGQYGLPADTIKGGMPISGIFDLHPLRYSFLQPKLLLTHELILRESPLLNIPPTGPPLLLSLGGSESAEFRRQSTEFLEAWRTNGLRGDLIIQEGKHHFSSIDGLADPNSGLCESLVDFMARCDDKRH
jgi:arylformamidase